MHQDDLSVLVFKEDRTPRVFLVPLAWFSRMGVILATLLIFSVVVSVIAIQNHFALKNARREFTREIEDEKRQPHASEAVAPPANTPAPAPTGAAKEVTPGTQQPPQDAANPNGAQEPTTAETAGPPPQSGPITGPLFSVFGRGLVSAIEDPAASPIALKNEHTAWNGRSLTAKFEIHYVRDDGGNQQGRIFVLARGPSTLATYPKGAFEPVGSHALIGLKNGEHFSVSRLRGVEARFDGIQRSEITALETFVVSDDGKLLIHEALPLK